MGDKNKSEIYEIKTTFNFEPLKLPSRRKVSFFGSRQYYVGREFDRKLGRSKSLEVVIQRYVKRGPKLVGKCNKDEEKNCMMMKRNQMLDKRTQILEKRRLASNINGSQKPLESSEINNTIHKYTSEKVYLPLVRSSGSADDLSKIQVNEKNSLKLNRINEKTCNSLFKGGLKFARQNSGIKSITKGIGKLKLPLEEDNFRKFNRMD